MSSIKPIIVALRDEAVASGVKVPQQKLNDAIALALYGRPYSAVMAAESAGCTPEVKTEGSQQRLAEISEKYRIDPGVLSAILTPQFPGTGNGQAKANSTLESLGFIAPQVASFKKMIRENSGIVFVAGATGSGKSRTLYGLIGRITEERGEGYRIALVTGSVEYEPEALGAIHVPVDDRIRYDDAMVNAIKTAEAMGVDAIMIDNAGGVGTLKAALDAASRGRMVYLAIHANDSWDVPLMLGGVDLVRGLVHQRLVKVLCRDCSTVFGDSHKSPPMNTMMRMVSLFPGGAHLALRQWRRGLGCPVCRGLGVIGRTVLAEVAFLTPEITSTLSGEGRGVARDLWMSEGDSMTLQMHAIHQIGHGIIDFSHAEEAIGVLSESVGRSRDKSSSDSL